MQCGRARQGIPARPIIVIAIHFSFRAGLIGLITFQFISPLVSRPHYAPPPAVVTWSQPVWKPKLTGVRVPDTPASGKLRGAGFSVAFAVYADQKLSLSDGDGPGSRAIIITLNQTPNRLPGASYDIWSDRVNTTLPIEMVSRGDNSGTNVSRVFTGGYSLKLKFGNRVKNKIPMKIYLCLPDLEKSYVGGTFDVTIERAKKRVASGKNSPDK